MDAAIVYYLPSLCKRVGGFIVYLATVLLILLKEECLSCKINRVKGNKI
jgi:hypothetical protein